MNINKEFKNTHLDKLPIEMLNKISNDIINATTTDNLTETILAFHTLIENQPFLNTIDNWSRIYSHVYNYDLYIPSILSIFKKQHQFSSTTAIQYPSEYTQQIPFVSYTETLGYNQAKNNSDICDSFKQLLNSLTLNEILLINNIYKANKDSHENYTGYFNNLPKVNQFFNLNTFFNQICYKFLNIHLNINNQQSTATLSNGTPTDMLNNISKEISKYMFFNAEDDDVVTGITFNFIDNNTIDITIDFQEFM